MNEKELLTTEQAAEYLGYSPETMRSSRCRGTLAGKPHPRYFKKGKAVRYRLEDLEDWYYSSWTDVDPGRDEE